MRAFVRLREMLLTNADLALKLTALKAKYDSQFKDVFDAIRQLMAPPEQVRWRAFQCWFAVAVGDEWVVSPPRHQRVSWNSRGAEASNLYEQTTKTRTFPRRFEDPGSYWISICHPHKKKRRTLPATIVQNFYLKVDAGFLLHTSTRPHDLPRLAAIISNNYVEPHPVRSGVLPS